jgi:flagellar FliL protein
VSTTTKTSAPDTGTVEKGSEKPKKSRKKLIIVAALLVLLAGGAFVGKGMLAGPGAPVPDPKTVAGNVVTLTPMTLNLADGRFLKLTLALQLSEAGSPAAGSVDAAVVPALDGAKALDAAIEVLGQRTYAQLLAPGGRAAAQTALSAQVKKRYDGDVLGVYFTEFLMQ